MAPSPQETSIPAPTPLPIPGGAPGVVLYGGTFDPPHAAHVELPRLARDRVIPDGWLLYVPAARSPLKPSVPAAGDADRVAMLRLALEGVPRAAVWTDEIDRAATGEPSYTVLTLERLRSLVGPLLVRLLIGADQAADLHRWREPRRIIELAEPVVMLRADADSADALLDRMRASGFWSEEELEHWRTRVLPLPRIDISATRVREMASRGDLAGVERAVGTRVAAYIAQRGLYQNR